MFRILTLLFVIAANSLFAEDYRDYLFNEIQPLPESKNSHCQQKYSFERKSDAIASTSISWRPYDVLKYDIYLDWYNMLSADSNDLNGRTWEGMNNMKIKIDSANTAQIEIDGKLLDIVEIDIDGIRIEPTPQADDFSILRIPVPQTAKQGDTLLVSIRYRWSRNDNEGIYIFPKGTYVGQGFQGDSVFTVEKIAYTFAEPIEGRAWLPCNDMPNDKADVSMHIRVPSDFNTASNGLLTRLPDGDTAIVDYWDSKYPMPTYLISVAASKFKYYNDWYHKISNPQDSILIMYFVWQPDYDNTATDGSYNARNSFGYTPGMMACYSEKYIEYPFEKYGMVAIQPYNMGGMEHQTMTNVNRSWLRGWNSYGIAHELSHQWLGDLITCATWNDIWINEGGATWSEAIWGESWGGADEYYGHMMYQRSSYLSSFNYLGTPIYGLPIYDVFNYALTYAKSSWIYHMLRTMLGDDVFFPVLRELLTTYSLKSLETDDFRDFFKSRIPNPPVSFDIFFDQWIYKAGHPVYNINTDITHVTESNCTASFDLSQTQSSNNVPDVFEVPVTLIFYCGDIVQTENVLNNQREQSFEFTLPSIPDSVRIDNRLVLCQLISSTINILDVKDNRDSEPGTGFSAFPNPASFDMEIHFDYKMEKPGFVRFSVYDELGKKVSDIFSGFLDDKEYRLTIPPNILSCGVYSIVCTGENKTESAKVIILR